MYRSVQLNLRVRPGLKATLANLAKQDRRTLSAYVEKLLEDHVAALGRPKPKPKASG
jgi:predicted HicB family RNase H-like nuclease